MTRTQHAGLVAGAALMASLFAHAESIYQEPTEFIAETFGDESPETRVLWINNNIRKEARTIIGRDLRQLRMRYWQKGGRTVWILDDIGKDLPITTGVVVESGAIKSVRVLIFRESRGWEVRYPFFTNQFIGTRLDANNNLDKNIDNISGATLSVNALKRQAQLALLLSTYIN
jgi:hypothetical protein